MTWKNIAIGLALLLVIQTWRNCSRAPAPKDVECAVVPPSETSHPRTRHTSAWDDEGRSGSTRGGGTDGVGEAEEIGMGPSINGFKLPAWTLYFAPLPGENMLAYRDRMLPVAQAALAPHRSRVARNRDDLAAKMRLDSQQRAQLDAAVQDAAGVIQDKVLSAALGGELSPATFKPMTGVSLARDVLDAVDKANQKFVSTLREDQKALLAKHPFDFADYLLFSARWEDALGVTN